MHASGASSLLGMQGHASGAYKYGNKWATLQRPPDRNLRCTVAKVRWRKLLPLLDGLGPSMATTMTLHRPCIPLHPDAIAAPAMSRSPHACPSTFHPVATPGGEPSNRLSNCSVRPTHLAAYVSHSTASPVGEASKHLSNCRVRRPAPPRDLLRPRYATFPRCYRAHLSAGQFQALILACR